MSLYVGPSFNHLDNQSINFNANRNQDLRSGLEEFDPVALNFRKEFDERARNDPRYRAVRENRQSEIATHLLGHSRGPLYRKKCLDIDTAIANSTGEERIFRELLKYAIIDRDKVWLGLDSDRKPEVEIRNRTDREFCLDIFNKIKYDPTYRDVYRKTASEIATAVILYQRNSGIETIREKIDRLIEEGSGEDRISNEIYKAEIISATGVWSKEEYNLTNSDKKILVNTDVTHVTDDTKFILDDIDEVNSVSDLQDPELYSDDDLSDLNDVDTDQQNGRIHFYHDHQVYSESETSTEENNPNTESTGIIGPIVRNVDPSDDERVSEVNKVRIVGFKEGNDSKTENTWISLTTMDVAPSDDEKVSEVNKVRIVGFKEENDRKTENTWIIRPTVINVGRSDDEMVSNLQEVDKEKIVGPEIENDDSVPHIRIDHAPEVRTHRIKRRLNKVRFWRDQAGDLRNSILTELRSSISERNKRLDRPDFSLQLTNIVYSKRIKLALLNTNQKVAQKFYDDLKSIVSSQDQNYRILRYIKDLFSSYRSDLKL